MDIQGRFVAIDRYQQRHAWLGFLLAVRQKYSEDQGGYLAATITYYGFFSIFPLLLVATTVLGFVLRGRHHLQQSLVHSALGQFPLIGDSLQSGHLRGNGLALGLGLVLSLWSGMGVFVAAQNAMDSIWGIPFGRRGSFVQSRLRALGLLAVLGAGVVGTTVLSGLGTAGASYGVEWKIGAVALSTLLDVGLFWVAFKLLTSGDVTWRCLRGGAIAAGIGWQILQSVGAYYVGHELKSASTVYGTFATVIVLLSFVYLSTHVTLLAAEGNVVADRRLWPRSFSLLGQRPPTDADRRALRQLADLHAQRAASDST